MSAQKSFSRNKQKGFTLIELMVTISIIAILATIGIAAYSQSQNVAKDGKRIADIQEIQKSLETYYNLNGVYPPNLSYNPPASPAPSSPSFSNNGYFQNGATPTDPNGTAYTYVLCNSAATQYELCATPSTCGNKCTAPAPLPTTNNCSTITSPGTSGNVYYCVKSLSN